MNSDLKIFLNDREYRISDLGEGKCTLMISYAYDIDSLYESFENYLEYYERIIVIDISISWVCKFDELSDDEREELLTDIILLADVYWLDDFEIKSDIICQ